MQAVAPEINALKEKYQSNPQKLNQATMELYKKKGVNPLGGCLPMLLQMPLLLALFQVFRSTIELRAEPFVWWIKDLSSPDTIFYLGGNQNYVDRFTDYNSPHYRVNKTQLFLKFQYLFK